MQVQVKLNLSLKRYSSSLDGKETLQLSGTTTVNQILEKLNIKHGEAFVILVNGKLIHDQNLELADGSHLELFPIFAGG